jgi:inner membrane transporter RhtA
MKRHTDAASALRARAGALAVLVLAMASIQVGAGLAKRLFALAGPEGVVALRLIFAAAILTAVWRPWRAWPRRSAWPWILAYGAALGVMNLCFYLAVARIPLGVAVAVELSGPLALALAASRRPSHVAWALLAIVGVALLTPWAGGRTDPAGIVLALTAGFFWALYIVFGRRAGLAHGGASVAIGMVVAAVLVAPVGVVGEGAGLLAPAVVPMALLVALLSSVLPYSLEMHALARLPTRTFSVLMSFEPAFAALAGFAILGERLLPLQLVAVACIVAASAGAASAADEN